MDVLCHFEESESQHVAVICNSRIYIIDEAVHRSLTNITKCLHHIVKHSVLGDTSTSFSIGALTHGWRKNWRAARNTLEQIESNQSQLALLDSAAFTVCLDDILAGSNGACFRMTEYFTILILLLNDYYYSFRVADCFIIII